nr:MAG TPA: hypothetical protein [Caudoviricetes sp.]
MKVYRRQIMQDMGGYRVVTLEFRGCGCNPCQYAEGETNHDEE